MKIDNKKFAAALIFPIICLAGLTVFKAVKIALGKEIIIPIVGYDPRDLLSGHYLIFRLDLNDDNFCRGDYENTSDVHMCVNQLDNNKVDSHIINPDDYPTESCDVILKGRCKRGRFTAGIERFYIPEQYSRPLDRIIRQGKGKLVVSVDGHGKASIKDLLINDRSWLEYIKEDHEIDRTR